MSGMTASIWLVIGLILFGLEMLIPGAYMLWLGAAAASVSLLVLVLDIDSLTVQAVLFAVCSLGLIALSIRYQKQLAPQASSTSLLNQKGNQLLGRHITIPDGFSHSNVFVSIDDSRWAVQGNPELWKPGARAVVVAVSERSITLQPAE